MIRQLRRGGFAIPLGTGRSNAVVSGRTKGFLIAVFGLGILRNFEGSFDALCLLRINFLYLVGIVISSVYIYRNRGKQVGWWEYGG